MENEKKKTKTKRLVILLAMLALIVFMVALGGTTFAKYITSQKVDTKTATVAKWGFVVKADGSKLFSEQYNHNVAVKADAEKIDIQAASDTLAPGSSGKVVFGVEGSAEVLANISIEATGTKDVYLFGEGYGTSTTDAYYPVKWTLKTASTEAGLASATGTSYNNLAAAIAAVNAIKISYTKDSATTESTTGDIPVGATVSAYYELAWTWSFEDASITDKDAKDTLLGYAANKADIGNYTVAANGTSVVDKGADPDVTTDDKTYNTSIELEFGLTVKVEQKQNAAA